MKLTKEMREDCIRRCVAATFKKDDELLLADRTKLGDALYAHAFGDIEKIARKLPANWCASRRSVDISCDGFQRYFHKEEGKPSQVLKLSKDRLFPASLTDAFTIKADHPMFDQAQAVVDLHTKINNEKQALQNHLTELLYSVTTLEKLKAAWPEGAKFFPIEEKKVMLPVPHSLTTSINRMMRLP